MRAMRKLWLGFSWRGLHLLSGWQERLTRRFTTAGQVLLTGTLAAGLFGVDTRQSLAFQMFSLGAALLLLSWLVSLKRPRGLDVRRRLPRYATVGEPCWSKRWCSVTAQGCRWPGYRSCGASASRTCSPSLGSTSGCWP